MKLNESVITKKSYQKEELPEGILARITYPIMRFNEVNANKRKYSKAVAEKVLKDASIQEKLKTRTLFGDVEHPDFVSAKLDPHKTANIISDLYIDEANQTFNAVVDLLPTLAGKFIFTLYEAGCDVGVSTRAEGDLSEEIDESTKEKVFSVIPESYRLSCLDTTADPSTSNARPLEFVKAVKANYESKKFDKESTLALLESVHTPEAISLLESIKGTTPLKEITQGDPGAEFPKCEKCGKATSDKGMKICHKCKEESLDEPIEEALKVGSIVRVLSEGSSYNGILNQMFKASNRAIVQIGVERKVVPLSAISALRLNEDSHSGDGSGLLAKKDEKEEDKKKEVLLDDKANQANETFPCSTCKAVKPMSEVGTHAFEEYTCKTCAEKVNESSLLDEIKDEEGNDVDASAQADNEMGASNSQEEQIIPGQDSDESDAQDNIQPPENDETPAQADETQLISSFETIEELLDYAITLEPKLQEYEREELIEGFTDEIEEHQDILDDDVSQLISVVLVHMEKSPHYYSVTEEALDQEEETNVPEAPEGGAPNSNAKAIENGSASVQEAIDTKRNKGTGQVEEEELETEGEGTEGAEEDSGSLNPEETDANPHHEDQPVNGSISKPGLYVVRHASTSYNSKDKSKDVVRGWTDVPLDAGGEAQALKIGEAFKSIKIDRIIYSDLSRTEATAKAIGDAGGVQDMVPNEAFRSWNMGDFQGKPSAEAVPELEKYAKEKPEEKLPGGESFKDFSERAISEFKKVIEEVKANNQTVVIVTHYRDIKLFQAWVATKTEDYSIDPNTFLSDDVEPGTVFYVNMEVEGIYNMDKVWEIADKEEEEVKDDKAFSESVNESSVEVDYNGTPIGWEKGAGKFWGKDANGKPKVTTDAKKVTIIDKELAKRREQKESKVNEKDVFAGWIAIFNGKKLEIKKEEAKDLWGAKQLAAQKLNVPKSKMGLLAIQPAYDEVNESLENNEGGDIPEGLKIGDKVLYAVYPFGTDIPGVVSARGIEVTDPKWIEYFKKEGVATYCEFDALHDVRKVNEGKDYREEKEFDTEDAAQAYVKQIKKGGDRAMVEPKGKKFLVIVEREPKNESLNEDENVGDALHQLAKSKYKKNYANLSKEEKDDVHLQCKAGTYPAKESNEKVEEMKLEMQKRVLEALHKAENDTLIENAEAIIKDIQTNYIKDVMTNSGVSESAKKLEKENNSLKVTLESLQKKSEALSLQISEAQAELEKKSKELEEAKAIVETKVEEVEGLQSTLVESRKSYEDKIINEKIRATARITGLKLGESEVSQLRECKTDGEFFKKLENIRESISQRILHQNVIENITIVENVPEKPVVVGGLKLHSSIIENVGTALDHMSGKGKRK